MSARSTRRLLQQRTAELRIHDPNDWGAWEHLPLELWPADALLSFVAGTGWADRLDAAEPTAAEVRAIVREATGCEIHTTPKDRK